MAVFRATVVSFASGSHTCSLRLEGSSPQRLDNIKVAASVLAAEMLTGRKVILDTGDHSDPADFFVPAVITGIAAVPGGPPYAPPVTTKGDLFGYAAAPARVPVGNNYQVLIGSSGSADGLSWIDAPIVLNRQPADNDIVNLATEQTVYTYTVPAAAMGATRALRLSLQGDYLNNSGAGRTFTLRVKFGATTLYADASAILATSASRRPWFLDILLGNQTATAQRLTFDWRIGSDSGATTGIGDYAATSAFGAVGGGESAENTANALALAVTIQHSLAAATISHRRRYAVLELL